MPGAVVVLAFVASMGGVMWWQLDPGEAPDQTTTAVGDTDPTAPDGPVHCSLTTAAAGASNLGDNSIFPGAARLTGRFGGRMLVASEVPLMDGVLDIDTRGIRDAGPERRWTDAQADTVLRLAGFDVGNAWLELDGGQVLAMAIAPDGGCTLKGHAQVQQPEVEVRCPLMGKGPLPSVAMVVTRPQALGDQHWSLAPVTLTVDRSTAHIVAQGPEQFTGTGWFTWDPREGGPDGTVGLPLSWDLDGCTPITLPPTPSTE